jgi:uncharacterized protein YqcC (DUF446 family)
MGSVADPSLSSIRSHLDAVIGAMKGSGAWDIARPAGEAFTDMGAFGSNTMAFEQWIRWVFVPNVEGLLASGGPWPKSSSVAVFAVREGDTNPVVASLVPALSGFDALFNPPEPGSEPASSSPPEASPAAGRTARADEVGRAILREIMAMPEFSMTGRVLTLGKAAPAPAGEVPTAWIGSFVGGRPSVHALVSDLESFAVVAVLTRHEVTPVFRAIQVRGADVREATRAVAEWLRSGGDLDPTSINPLDAAVILNETLAVAVPTSAGFRVAAHADHYRPDLPAMAGVHEGSLTVLATARSEGGVRIDLPPEHMEAKIRSVDVPSFARFVEAKEEILASVRRAIATRDAFVKRAFPVGLATQSVAQALRDEAWAKGARWECRIGTDHYPSSWPSAWIQRKDGKTERSVVNLVESEEGVAIRVDDGGPSVVVRSVAELHGELAAVLRRARERCGRLTADALVPGETYRVLLPMAGFDPGDTVKFVETEYIRHDGIEIYRFASTSRPGIVGQLDDSNDASLAILRKLDLYLEPASA